MMGTAAGSKRGLVAGALVAAVVLTLLYLTSTPPTPVDLRADRLTARALLDGTDPYRPVVELAAEQDSDLWWDWIHPRTPGALVLQMPLAALDEDAMRVLAVGGTAVALVLATALTVGSLGLPGRWLLPGALLVGMLSISVEAATVGAQSSVLAALLVFAWARLRSGDDALAGCAVGVAVTLKVFPWLLLVPLFFSRRRALAAAVVTGAGFAGIGLVFPGVSIGGALTALSSANQSAALDLNASLTRLLPEAAFEPTTLALALAGLAVSVYVAGRDWSFDRRWFAVMAVGLAASPLVWSHYALVLVPALWWMVGHGGRGRRVAGILSAALIVPSPLFVAWFAVPMAVFGVLFFAVAVGGDEVATA